MIGAIVLAAGLSSRMGEPKLLLPWGDTTILGQVLRALKEAEVQDILVVTGTEHKAVGVVSQDAGCRTVQNPRFHSGEMLSSIQVGLVHLDRATKAALIVLGDQPGIQTGIVSAVIKRYEETGVSLIVPSYQRRRGHPWLVARELWPRLQEMQPPATPRDFLNSRSGVIHYVEVDSASIVEDIDTPEDYRRLQP